MGMTGGSTQWCAMPADLASCSSVTPRERASRMGGGRPNLPASVSQTSKDYAHELHAHRINRRIEIHVISTIKI